MYASEFHKNLSFNINIRYDIISTATVKDRDAKISKAIVLLQPISQMVEGVSNPD